MKGKRISSSLILLLLIMSIVSLDISRRYLAGDFEGDKLELEVLYSSEKAGWLESVVEDFEDLWSSEHSGNKIKVVMTPIGTGKGTIQVANEGSKPTVWSPASRFWIPILNRLWETNHNNQTSNSKLHLMFFIGLLNIWILVIVCILFLTSCTFRSFSFFLLLPND